jgi:electron transport complex protein RnfA
MTSYLFIVIGAVLVNNVVFGRILGLCPFMGVSKKLETAIGMGAPPPSCSPWPAAPAT